VENLLQHLRGGLDEIALDAEASLTGPLALAAEDVVHEVAELVEEGDDFVVLHEAGVASRATGEVTDQHSLGNLTASDAGNDGRGGEPLVLALARMHVEIDAAKELALRARSGVEDVKGVDGFVPDNRIGDRLEGDMEKARGGFENAVLHLGIGEVGTDALRVKGELGAAVLLAPVVGVGLADAGESGLLLSRESEQLSVFTRGNRARGVVNLLDEALDACGGTDHLVGGSLVREMSVAERGG
jgi:hypothetical protein